LGIRLSHYLRVYRLIPLCYYFLRFYLSLLRIRVIGEEIALGCLADYGRLIVAVWHQRFLPALAYVTKFRNFEPIVMISQSRDGELIADLAERLGLVPVRGSSSRGGTTALAGILEALKKSPVVIHIVDGPTGPKGVVNMGSWDRFLVPKPFSEVTIEWGQPFVVPRDLDPLRFEELRTEIERSLSARYAEADLSSGWEQPL